ncbi:MAG: ABC transporter ATP-binding protein [candidate division WOR-3 bacterium]
MQMKLENLSKKFNGLFAVYNVNATFHSGKITALIGPNGAGKTTLFNIISGFLKPDSGNVIIEDKGEIKNVTNLSPFKIAQLGVGRLFQDVRVFKRLTVMENILAAMKNQKGENPLIALFSPGIVKKQEIENQKKAMELLKIVGLGDKIGKYAEDLSWGEQKLLAIARLLAGENNILLLDEPAHGINPLLFDSILQLIKNISNQNDKIIIIIEHNIGVVKKIADYIYFMDEGKIIAEGRPQDVLNNYKVKEIYIGI